MEHIDMESQSGICCCLWPDRVPIPVDRKFWDVPTDAKNAGVVVTPGLHS